MTLVYKFGALAVVLLALWLHGYSRGAAVYKTREQAAIAVARADAERQARAVDGLQVEVDALRSRRPVVRERLVEVARDVVREIPTACVLPAALRGLWDAQPGDGVPTRSAGGPDAAVSAVANDGGRG